MSGQHWDPGPQPANQAWCQLGLVHWQTKEDNHPFTAPQTQELAGFAKFLEIFLKCGLRLLKNNQYALASK